MKAAALLALLALAGCSYTETDPDGYREASCHERAFVTYCVINVKPGQTVVGSASGVVPAIGGGTGGAAGAALVTDGATLLLKH